MKTTFGQLKPGAIFCLSPNHFDHGMEYMNVKMDGFGIYRGKDGKTIDQVNEEHPFNVIALGDGRPRTFHDGSTVFVRD